MKVLRYLSLLLAAVMLFACSREEVLPPDEELEQSLPYLHVSKTEFRADLYGDVFVSEIECPVPIQVNAPDWCEVILVHQPENSPSGAVKIKVGRNQGTDRREGEVILSAKDCKAVSIRISQDGRVLATTNTLYSFKLTAQANPSLGQDVEFQLDKQEKSYSAIHLKWMEGDHPEMLVPSFRTDGYEVHVHGEPVVSGVTRLDFSEDMDLEVIAENGDKQVYKIIFNCPQINTELPVMHLKPERLIDSKEYYVKTGLELYDRTGKSDRSGWWDSKVQGPVEMKRRGNSTWGLPKKPFRLKFPEKMSPVGLDHTRAKNWALLAQDMDKSLVRTYIAFEYSRLLLDPQENYHDPHAILFSPHTQFVNVYFTGPYYDSSQQRTVHMEGDYLGVYQLTDRLDDSKGRIEIEKLTAADGGNPDKITGGYLIEADLHDGSHYTGRGIKFSYKYPKDDDHAPEQYRYLSDFLNKCESHLYAYNFRDPAEGWRKYFDEKTLADFIIIKELVGDMDGFTSIYAYKRRGFDKLFFGPVWDCDKGWANDVRVPHHEYPPRTSLMMFAGFWMPPYVYDDWFQHVWQDETFRAFVNRRWQSKRKELLDLTDRLLDETPAKMKKAIQANFTVWNFNYQYSGEAPKPQRNYESEIKYIRELTYERAELLDREFAR